LEASYESGFSSDGAVAGDGDCFGPSGECREPAPGRSAGNWRLCRFPDDGGTLNHWAAGGSIRYFFTRRLAIEPEFLFLRESRADQDFHFIPNLVFEFFKNPGNVQPYLIGGVGLQRHRELTGTGFYSSNSAIFGGGLGAKIFVSDRWYVAPEFRIGWEPFFRITGSVGYIISGGKRKRF
jgi:hypothetical protein